MINALSFCTKDQEARRKFTNRIYELVCDNITSFDELYYSDKKEVVGLYLAALDDKEEWIYESQYLIDTSKEIYRMLTAVKDQEQAKERVIEALEHQVITYFTPLLNSYFKDVTQEYKQDLKNHFDEDDSPSWECA
ncbi:MAG TPA: hypothetical protein VGW78_07600 [Candidatus Babeliales bacterium]|jgi:hypothetical protein|nr:hypothetical protein [Candidatus Babeliales bacterium]